MGVWSASVFAGQVIGYAGFGRVSQACWLCLIFHMCGRFQGAVFQNSFRSLRESVDLYFGVQAQKAAPGAFQTVCYEKRKADQGIAWAGQKFFELAKKHKNKKCADGIDKTCFFCK